MLSRYINIDKIPTFATNNLSNYEVKYVDLILSTFLCLHGASMVRYSPNSGAQTLSGVWIFTMVMITSRQES